MPRYHLHLRGGSRATPDEKGAEFPDIDAAREEAWASAREILAEAIRSGDEDVPDSIMIADASGRELEAVTLYEALPKPLRR